MVAPNFKDLREIPASKNSFKRIIRKQIISTYNAWFSTSKNDSLFGISSGAPLPKVVNITLMVLPTKVVNLTLMLLPTKVVNIILTVLPTKLANISSIGYT